MTESQQPSTSGSTDARRGGATVVTKHVTLTRPHTLLLMSSVAGGFAIRGAFTGAIARQFAKADGKITINDMVTNAIIEMKKFATDDDVLEQAPESRNTLQKILILPPKVENPGSKLPGPGRLSKDQLFKELGVNNP